MGYALWLVPSGLEFQALQQFMKFRPNTYQKRSHSRSYPRFDPHITICTFNLPSSSRLPALASIVPADAQRTAVIFDSMRVGTNYLGALSIDIWKSRRLIKLHDRIVNRLESTYHIETKSRRFPHMSLFYVDESEERQRLGDALDRSGRLNTRVDGKGLVLSCTCDDGRKMDLGGYCGDEVWLVDCNSRSVREWFVIEKTTIDGARAASVGQHISSDQSSDEDEPEEPFRQSGNDHTHSQNPPPPSPSHPPSQNPAGTQHHAPTDRPHQPVSHSRDTTTSTPAFAPGFIPASQAPSTGDGRGTLDVQMGSPSKPPILIPISPVPSRDSYQSQAPMRYSALTGSQSRPPASQQANPKSPSSTITMPIPAPAPAPGSVPKKPEETMPRERRLSTQAQSGQWNHQSATMTHAMSGSRTMAAPSQPPNHTSTAASKPRSTNPFLQESERRDDHSAREDDRHRSHFLRK